MASPTANRGRPRVFSGVGTWSTENPGRVGRGPGIRPGRRILPPAHRGLGQETPHLSEPVSPPVKQKSYDLRSRGYSVRCPVKGSSVPSVLPLGSLRPTLSPDVPVAQPGGDFSRTGCWASALAPAFLMSSPLPSLGWGWALLLQEASWRNQR